MDVSPVPDSITTDVAMLNDSLDEVLPSSPLTSKLISATPPANNIDCLVEEEEPVLFSNPSDTMQQAIPPSLNTTNTQLDDNKSNDNNDDSISYKTPSHSMPPSQSTPPLMKIPQVKIAPCFGKKKKNVKTTTTTTTTVITTAVAKNSKITSKSSTSCDKVTSPLSGTSGDTPTTGSSTVNNTTPTSTSIATLTKDSMATPTADNPLLNVTNETSVKPDSDAVFKLAKPKKVSSAGKKTADKKEERERIMKEKCQEKEKKEARKKKLKEKQEEKERAKELKRFLQEEKKLEKKIKKEESRTQTRQKLKNSPKCTLSVQTESIIITSPVLETTPTIDTPIIDNDTPMQSDAVSLQHETPLIVPPCNSPTPLTMPSIETPPTNNSQTPLTTPSIETPPTNNSQTPLTTPSIKAPPTNRHQCDGLWVQCDNPDCHKWRYLKDCIDPSFIPDKWYCSMNTDTTCNTCEASEEVWSELDDNEEYIYSPYVPGSIILAKLEGYPWWPAMVEADPDNDCYYNKDNDISTPDQYHVVFFDTPVSRGWIHVLNISPFTNETSIKQCGSQIPYKCISSLSTALSEAHEALDLSLTERLSRWSFNNRYGNNRKRKNSDKKTKRTSKKRKNEIESPSDKENDIPEDMTC